MEANASGVYDEVWDIMAKIAPRGITISNDRKVFFNKLAQVISLQENEQSHKSTMLVMQKQPALESNYFVIKCVPVDIINTFTFIYFYGTNYCLILTVICNSKFHVIAR